MALSLPTCDRSVATLRRRSSQPIAARLILPPFSRSADVEYVCLDANPSGHVTLHGVRDFKVGLIGHGKDGTSYYLRMFPDWDSVDVVTQHGTLNGTDLRVEYFRRMPRLPDVHHCPKATIDFLARFMLTDTFKWLLAEAQYYEDYKAAWGKTPYPVFINCVDAVVVQSGHILLVERAHHPGQGLLALPGGHVNPDENFRDAQRVGVVGHTHRLGNI